MTAEFENGVLYLRCDGYMDNFTEERTPPWYRLPFTSVQFTGNILSIGDYAFYYCSDMASITIPNSVITIGNYAFYGCYGITEINLPDSLQVIGHNAFSDCSQLSQVTFSNNLKSIGSSSFSSCSLTNIVFNSIETIESEQTQAQSSFIMVDGQFREYRFDLSAYAGQTVVISIEYNVVSRTEYGGGPMYIDEICFL